jgi:hypothetical protein
VRAVYTFPFYSPPPRPFPVTTAAWQPRARSRVYLVRKGEFFFNTFYFFGQ